MKKNEDMLSCSSRATASGGPISKELVKIFHVYI